MSRGAALTETLFCQRTSFLVEKFSTLEAFPTGPYQTLHYEA